VRERMKKKRIQRGEEGEKYLYRGRSQKKRERKKCNPFTGDREKKYNWIGVRSFQACW
jgi:hypothetical protein